MRGVIRNREHASQLRDFRRMRWGSITPTDLDVMLDFRGRLFVLVELKHRSGGRLSGGQRLCYERMLKAWTVPACLILAFHDGSGDIDTAGASADLLLANQALQKCGALPDSGSHKRRGDLVEVRLNNSPSVFAVTDFLVRVTGVFSKAV